jgi:hypothetical protein
VLLAASVGVPAPAFTVLAQVRVIFGFVVPFALGFAAFVLCATDAWVRRVLVASGSLAADGVESTNSEPGASHAKHSADAGSAADKDTGLNSAGRDAAGALAGAIALAPVSNPSAADQEQRVSMAAAGHVPARASLPARCVAAARRYVSWRLLLAGALTALGTTTAVMSSVYAVTGTFTTTIQAWRVVVAVALCVALTVPGVLASVFARGLLARSVACALLALATIWPFYVAADGLRAYCASPAFSCLLWRCYLIVARLLSCRLLSSCSPWIPAQRRISPC